MHKGKKVLYEYLFKRKLSKNKTIEKTIFERVHRKVVSESNSAIKKEVEYCASMCMEHSLLLTDLGLRKKYLSLMKSIVGYVIQLHFVLAPALIKRSHLSIWCWWGYTFRLVIRETLLVRAFWRYPVPRLRRCETVSDQLFSKRKLARERRESDTALKYDWGNLFIACGHLGS